MLKPLIVLASVALTACAAPAPYRSATAAGPVDQALDECKYEATKATANIRSGIEAGWMQGTITRQCMRAKGFTQ